MAIKMRSPYVKVLDASEAEKDRYAYELAMFLYGVYKDKGDTMGKDKTTVNDT